MKKIAIIIYPGYCLFEITTFLEALVMSGAKAEFFSEELIDLRSEEGILIKADRTFDELLPSEFDGIVFSGFSYEYPIKNDSKLISIIQEFDKNNKIIGAISIAPIFLLKANILKEKTFMCGCLKKDLIEEGFNESQLEFMLDWKDCTANYDKFKFKKSDNIITSVAYGYREWSMELCEMLGLDTYPKSFGLAPKSSTI